MLSIPVYNMKGDKVGDEQLNPKIFDVEIREGLVHKYVDIYLGNIRKNITSAKGRSDVRGGGRKPWKQKGTGRARAGSIRSPLWKGGGVTFGPNAERNYKRKMNRKEKRKALLMALSSKQNDKKIIIVDDIKFNKAKTKDASELIKNLKIKENSVLVALNDSDDNVVKSFRNIKKSNTSLVKNMNTYNVLKNNYLILTKKALETLNKLHTI